MFVTFAMGAAGQHRFGFEVIGVPLAALIVFAAYTKRRTPNLHAHNGNKRCSFDRSGARIAAADSRHGGIEMANTINQQQNTMDEPGGPEAPLTDENTRRTKTKDKRADKAAHGEPTDPDFEPPVVPGDTHGASRD